MGEAELKKALQREGEAQVGNLWQQAEAAVAIRRKELEAERLQLRVETDRQLQAQVTVLRNDLLFEAQTRAMGCRLHAETALEERLLLLARQLLPELANDDRSALWKVLCEELPDADWTTLKVHPADHKLADRDFPAAEIERDETLGGGLIVTSADGMIRVDNSLSCRLLRAWPDLLPKLLGELRKLVNDDETAHTDKTG
jgi:vacuolar-type H+-ATPase subunit E/Vma4